VLVMGVVIDGYESAESFANIAEAYGVTFINLLADKALSEFIDANIEYVPTTYIVSPSGVIIGEPIIGADVAAYRMAVRAFLGN